ncbi:MAG: DNA mismatch repair endonuclease MutL [Planctomycetes bacterium]|nr:DNA mismatch repair endonuclease MutL [Planctomycetota bacterium]
MSIQVLPKILVDKIAAGEVIERPASVVKELVENSLDAGANRIEVELEDGGTKLIRVSDDGHGMSESDLALAFVSHSTSKLDKEEDLFDVRTMGFRGEALSSIAAVSQARITSRTAESDAGYEITAEGGEIGQVKPTSSPPGTQVEVRNLFFNVPVRRKFMKTPATEMAHVSEAVTRLALAYPEVSFVLEHQSRKVFNLPPADHREGRISEFFGSEIADNIISMNERHPEVEIEGYLLPPSVDRSNTTMQYTYVNRRYVREKTLMHAVGQGYRGLMRKGRRPVCFIFLTIDPGDVDVNVHPTKVEVKFRRSRDIHNRVVSGIRETLRQAHITPEVRLTDEEGSAEQQDSVRTAISDFFANRNEKAPAGGHGSFSPHPGAMKRGGIESVQKMAGPGPEVHYGNTAQMLDTYIVEEAENGIRIIDQHALHERILFEKMRTQLEEGPLNSQRLLVPELVELPKTEFYAVMDMQEDLKRFGMEIESFGDNTVVVRSFPQLLGKFDGPGFFRELLEELEGPEKARRASGRMEKLLKIMSCRGAVKAGDRLSPNQIKSILKQRKDCENPDTCPHGRPTMIVMTKRELEKNFHRG